MDEHEKTISSWLTILDNRGDIRLIASMTTIVAEKNQVSIPERLATDLGIKPGTQLDWQAADSPDMMIVKVLSNRSDRIESVFGAGQKFLQPGADPIRDLIADRVREDTTCEVTP